MTTRIGRAVLRAALGPVLEGLEHRLLLVSSLSNGTWTISFEDEPEQAHRVVLTVFGGTSLRAVVDRDVSYDVPMSDVYTVFINGGPLDDVLIVRGGVPEGVRVGVNGQGGNDKIVASRAAMLFGGDGDDTIKGSAERDEIGGGAGNDLIFGKGGGDSIMGDGGNDRLYGGADEDEISGGFGDDQLFGGTGGDELGGGHGLDHLAGAAGADTLHGHAGDDTLRGGADGDVLGGGFDDDIVLGQRGADTLRGGLGVDRLVGGADVDTVHRERDVDWLRLEAQDTVEDDVFEEPLTRSDDAAALKRMLIDEAVEVWSERLGSASTPLTQWRRFRVGEDGTLDPLKDPAYGPGVCGYFTLGEWVNSDLCGGGGDGRTNVQEQDVDEADLVKTDGRHLYVAREGELLAIDATRAGEPRLVSRTEIGGEVLGLYLRGTTVTVLSQAPEDYEHPACVRGVWFDASPIEPGATCEVYVRKPRELNVWVLDVSEPSAPVVVERTQYDGMLLTSRMVDGRGYFVVHNSLDLPGPRRTWHEVPPPPTDWDGTEPIVVLDANGEAVYGANPIEWHDEKSLGQIKGYFLYETEAEYRARLEAMSLEELVPGYATFDGEGAVVSEGGLVGAGRMHFSETKRNGERMYGGGRYWDMTSVVTIDLDDDEPGPVGSTSVAGFEPGTVYASAENLWLTRPRFTGGDEATDVYRFELEEDGVSFGGSGQVPGDVVDSFSMDEQDGLLRVATTMRNAASNLFVLEADGEGLEIVGAVREIAPGERIMSARFLEDRAYVVTFRQVDPLFTVDLRDPRRPKLVGELKVPGFSTYLHPLEDGLLIGVGRDADAVTGRATGVQVSLFDVARMEKPVRLDVDVLIEGSWANSVSTAALYDHHAFAYFADEGVLALPVHWKERVGSESEDRFETKLWRVDGEEGLKEIATIGHESAVARNVMIGGFVYSVAADGVKVVDLRTAGAVVGEVGFGE